MELNRQGQLVCDWQEFREYCGVVANLILNQNKSYSQIIAIVRGGFYLADYLSRKLQLPLSVIVARSYYHQQKESLTVGELSCIVKPTSKILLVDDLVDTGTTLAVVKQKLIDDFAVEVDTAVVWCKSQSQFIPDYYHSETPSDCWIHQPFEV